MQYSLEQRNRLSLFNNCEVVKGKFAPIISPVEGLSVTHFCDNPYRTNIITCRDKRLPLFIKEVNGLELDTTLHSTIDLLPHYFPSLDKQSCKQNILPQSFQFIGITVKDILASGFRYKASTLQQSSSIKFEENLVKGSLKGKKVILFLTGEDMLIETLWHKRESLNFFSVLKGMGFYAVCGFNFSLFGGECAASHQLNLKRSLYSCQLIEEKGMKAIPHVYVLTEYHIKRWAEWFQKNPSVKCFAMNCQLSKENVEMFFLIRNLKNLLSRIDNSITVILQGFQSDFIKYLNPYLHRIHFTDKDPIKSAIFKKRYVYDTSKNKLIRVPKSQLTFVALAKTNILKRRDFIEQKFKQTPN